MVAGALAFVLHGHLPYVRSRHPGSLEEDWFFQALTESYLPLIEMLQRSLQQGSQPRLTMSLSPTLLSLLVDPVLQERYEPWLQQRIELLQRSGSDEQAAAADLSQHLERQRQAFRRCGGNVLKHFVQLQRQGVLDLLTCCATHGYLPLLRDPSAAVQGQLRTAVREHERLIGEAPRGIWLPECAYFEGLDQQLAKAGLRYAILDAHGLLHALPRPRYGVYAPICSPGAVAFFGRDSEATLPVWSASDGYPGDPSYREFHRDIGWDLEESELQAAGIPSSRPLGLKLRRVSGGDCPLEAKLPYDPAAAERTAAAHAQSYVQARIKQLSELGAVMDQPPMVVAPFDAELFGHWWFEGPRFFGAGVCPRPGPGLELHHPAANPEPTTATAGLPALTIKLGTRRLPLLLALLKQRLGRAGLAPGLFGHGGGHRRPSRQAQPQASASAQASGAGTLAGAIVGLELHPAGGHHH